MRLRDLALRVNEDHPDFISRSLIAKDVATELALYVRAAYE